MIGGHKITKGKKNSYLREREREREKKREWMYLSKREYSCMAGLPHRKRRKDVCNAGYPMYVTAIRNLRHYY